MNILDAPREKYKEILDFHYQDGEEYRYSISVMQFRLLYSGQLLGASRNNTRSEHKHKVRLEFHPQIKRLWETNSNLQMFAAGMAASWFEKHPRDLELMRNHENESDLFQAQQAFGLKHLGETWARGKREYIPLITDEMDVRCALDILFLRPEDKGLLFKRGDLDNRLKTIFDALRMPPKDDGIEVGEIGSGPIYCLLEDDRSISEVRVVADNLLMLPNASNPNANDAFLVIEVNITVPSHNPWKWAFN